MTPTWLSVADMILTALTDYQPGILLTSVVGNLIDFHAAKKHVDDSRQGINEGGVERFDIEHGVNLSLEEAANKAKQAFKRYFLLSGGKLVIEKIMFHVLYPDVERGG